MKTDKIIVDDMHLHYSEIIDVKNDGEWWLTAKNSKGETFTIGVKPEFLREFKPVKGDYYVNILNVSDGKVISEEAIWKKDKLEEILHKHKLFEVKKRNLNNSFRAKLRKVELLDFNPESKEWVIDSGVIAYFHRWVKNKGGVLAIIEKEDGRIKLEPYKKIKFI